jgi:hypothetical protein
MLIAPTPGSCEPGVFHSPLVLAGYQVPLMHKMVITWHSLTTQHARSKQLAATSQVITGDDHLASKATIAYPVQ